MSQPAVPAANFRPEEATVASVHAALAAGQLTCVQVVGSYLERIAAFDDKGPALNALITVNNEALQTAAKIDAQLRASRGTLRPLDCIPVILKDNFDTADMPTTGGSLALAKSVPLRDAFVVSRLRNAGAVILAKANMTELALGGSSVSSMGGQTKNPYDLTRTPGGSSGGTGASIAASFAIIGTGSDTGQSIRSPASAQSLVGIRPTRGLLSRRGIIPASTTQDEVGPITRTVEDAARALTVMAGYDPEDPVTALGWQRIPPTYTAFLDANGLSGARIGVLQDFFGGETIHQEVNAVVRRATERMSGAGATMVPIRIPNFAELTEDTQLTQFEFRAAFNAYLAKLGPATPVKNLSEFIASGQFHDSIAGALAQYQRADDALNSVEYQRRLLRRDALRLAVMRVMAENKLDAILYPHQKRLVVPIGEEQIERNGVLSNSTGLPAITFPGGFSPPTAAAPIGVPVGIELLGAEWSEPVLIKLAFAYEQLAKIRRPPRSTPPLRR
jgi:Asp-tRNA(Asn)/Glu-tRNA(Gln) amidotransferase A subunit family amidase